MRSEEGFSRCLEFFSGDMLCYVISSFLILNEICFCLGVCVGRGTVGVHFEEACTGNFTFYNQSSACQQTNVGIVSRVLGAFGTCKLPSV